MNWRVHHCERLLDHVVSGGPILLERKENIEHHESCMFSQIVVIVVVFIFCLKPCYRFWLLFSSREMKGGIK